MEWKFVKTEKVKISNYDTILRELKEVKKENEELKQINEESRKKVSGICTHECQGAVVRRMSVIIRDLRNQIKALTEEGDKNNDG